MPAVEEVCAARQAERDGVDQFCARRLAGGRQVVSRIW
jgi:hypothetical protein